jgi:hypothetical protein
VDGWTVAQRGRGAYKGAGGGRTASWASGRVSDRGAALGVGGWMSSMVARSRRCSLLACDDGAVSDSNN